MMKNPRNLLIFAVLGGIVGTGLGLAVGRFSALQTSTWDEKVDLPQVIAVLDRQEEAWNSGDIDGYMQGYVKADTLRFASGGTITNGWQTTLDRYQRRYPDRAAMGKLTTENFEINVIDADDALVFGSWELERESDNPRGLYTLHLKKIDGVWVVISDHTSSAE
ncbi:periplasmic L-asparaginase [Litorimonas cladophorae]|uniref:Periplasmic L-asparaginase n=1 Tax=Litorimonas cladophorae TaxID=1220491 RepID=A0A918NCB8_9PROT|nr:nuclear transport factor 2 family protein [Litorimonas cladophorae]GGX57266.1 periplasmic L-asparaginase [Litorimonas cladophorae]